MAYPHEKLNSFNWNKKNIFHTTNSTHEEGWIYDFDFDKISHIFINNDILLTF